MPAPARLESHSRPDLPPVAPVARPLVSVLLACRDAARHLPAALAGIELQTWRPLELLAVDDGSVDGTGAILRRFAAARSWVRVLETPGVGPSAARAAAFAASSGDLIAIHDADDVSRRDRFERQVAFLAEHPEVGVLGSAADVIDERGARIGAHPVAFGAGAIARALRRAPPFVHGSVVLRREAYVEAGGFRAGFRAAEDYDLWLRIPPRFALANLPETLYQWREHEANSFRRHRTLHLEYLAIARAFADERRARTTDSAPLLLGSESLESFRARYPMAARLSRYRGEAFIRDGRVREGRRALGEAWRSTAEWPAALAWWCLSWPVALTPRARRAGTGGGAAA
jgi:glycosyltransferase involved in cell wall biosynthesis